MRARPWAVLVTAEHGGNEVPSAFSALFRGRRAALDSHRGWDPGTLALATRLASALRAPLVSSTVTRLLVDLNRSPHNPRVFSEVTRPLPRAQRLALLEEFHTPHWSAARAGIERGLAKKGRVLHLAVHSFTPVLDGHTRKPDIALLYDPSRPAERALVTQWARSLRAADAARVLRLNNPYRGYDDGLPTALRREHGTRDYIGIEIEINQKHVGPGGEFPAWVSDTLLGTLPERLP